MNDFIEQQIIEAVRKMLKNKVNKIIEDLQFLIPLIEFSGYSDSKVITPVITLSACEKSEKERIIQLDVYALAIQIHFKNEFDSELFCYAYAFAVNKALKEDTTLDGVVDRTVMTERKYTPPKSKSLGEGWALNITLRVTVEGMNV
jgi:hypothetical protein